MDVVRYYSQEFWDQNGDPLTSTFFGMDNPFFFFNLGCSLIFLIRVILPQYMKSRQPIDLRSVYIISNGHAFGIILVGILTGMVNSRYFLDCFACQSYRPTDLTIDQIFIRLIAYIFMWVKIQDFMVPVFSILAKKDDKVTNLQLLHLLGALMFVWVGTKVNPGGIFITVALADGLYNLFVYGYLIMMAASTEIRPRNKNFRFRLFYFRMISVLLTFFHQLYFLFAENCFTKEVRLFSVMYLTFTAILFPIDFFYRVSLDVNKSSVPKELDDCPQSLKEADEGYNSYDFNNNQSTSKDFN